MSKHISIDLGTSNTKIALFENDVVLNEPSIAAVDLKTGQLVSNGRTAKSLLGKAPKDISVISPLSGGMIADFEVASFMLSEFIKTILPKSIIRPKAVLIHPHNMSAVEQKILTECASRANVRTSFSLDTSVAAAIGSGIDVSGATGNLIVDIGGGKTSCASISFGGVVTEFSDKTAGCAMDSAISSYIEKTYATQIGKKTAEEIKINFSEKSTEDEMSVMGRCEKTGLPKKISLTREDFIISVSEVFLKITETIKKTIKNTPEELLFDITNSGICLVGAGAHTYGLSDFIEKEVGISTFLSKNPENAAAIGACSLFKRSENE